MKVTLSISQSILTELVTLLRFVENHTGITPYQAKRALTFIEAISEAMADPDTLSRDPEPMPDSESEDVQKKRVEMIRASLAASETNDPLIQVWSAYDGNGRRILADSVEDFMRVSHTLVTSGSVRAMRRSVFDALQDYQPS